MSLLLQRVQRTRLGLRRAGQRRRRPRSTSFSPNPETARVLPSPRSTRLPAARKTSPAAQRTPARPLAPSRAAAERCKLETGRFGPIPLRPRLLRDTLTIQPSRATSGLGQHVSARDCERGIVQFWKLTSEKRGLDGQVGQIALSRGWAGAVHSGDLKSAVAAARNGVAEREKLAAGAS